METTLCLIKPDGVRRGLVGEILARFDRMGLKIVAMKMITSDKERAGKHYTYEDIAVRHGEHIRNALIDFITSGPVVAFAVEGICVIENVRKLCGSTEPLKALPGTIRGDFAHHSYTLTGAKKESIRNLIHASANEEDAQRELSVWFEPSEFSSYRKSDQNEHFLD